MTNKTNKQLLLGLSIATIFALGIVSYNTFAHADAQPGTTDQVIATNDVVINAVPNPLSPFAQHNFGSKSISLYFNVDTQILDKPTTINIDGFTVDENPEAKFTLIEADGQQIINANIHNPYTFNGALMGNITGADGPAVAYWDTLTNDVSGNVTAGDTSATIVIDSIGSTTDCLVSQGIVFEEGSGQSSSYVANGTALRDESSGTISISGIPSDHVLAAAYLYWNVLNRTEVSDQIDINGQTISANLTGSDFPDPCWLPGGANFNGTTWGFVADVTSKIVGNGNGDYLIDNFPEGLMEGASLVIVHADSFDAIKSWTHTDYNWDQRCDGYLNATSSICQDSSTNSTDIGFRSANINIDDDVLADPLDQDSNGNYTAFAQVNKNKFKNTNPGAFYAMTTVEIETDLDSLTVDELYSDCTDNGNGILEFVSKKIDRNIKVAVADSNGDVTELTDDLYDGIGGSIVADIDDANVIISDSNNLTAGSTVYVLVKFQDNSSNIPVINDEVDVSCDNTEVVNASFGGLSENEAPNATLRITNLE